MSDQFWIDVQKVLTAAAAARTADELIAAVKLGPDQHSGDSGAAALFAGSGGDGQLGEALDDNGHWDLQYVEGDYWWKATARADGSTVEYIEGDVYLR